MNINALKKIIKESVEDVIRDEIQVLREELAEILRPAPQQKTYRPTLKEMVENPTEVRETRSKLREMYESQLEDDGFQLSSGRRIAQSGVPIPPSITTGNPYAAFLEDAADNMTAQDIAGLKNMGN